MIISWERATFTWFIIHSKLSELSSIRMLLTSIFFSTWETHFDHDRTYHSLFLGFEKIFDLILLHSKIIFNTHDLTFVYFVLCAHFRWLKIMQTDKVTPVLFTQKLEHRLREMCSDRMNHSQTVFEMCIHISSLYSIVYIWKADKLKKRSTFVLWRKLSESFKLLHYIYIGVAWWCEEYNL